MYNFFVSENSKSGDNYIISSSDHNHIKNVLRLKCGDTVLISENGQSNLCEITALGENETVLKIIEKNFSDNELPIKIYLFQGLPKSDKLELIIQKCVELGVYEIIPVQMKRCVVKIDDKKKESKIQRWQAISESAAKQSKRNIIPKIGDIISFDKALEKALELDTILLPYEAKNGMQSTKEALSKLSGGMSVGIFIGPEGGFEDDEVQKAIDKGARIISLGKRILRTETAAISAVNMCMLYSELTSEG